MLTGGDPAAFAVSALVWAIYATLVAAVGLWGFDPRGLGIYSAWGAVVMIGQIIYGVVDSSLAGLICGIVQVIAFAMLFVHLAIPVSALKKATAWILAVVGMIHGVLAALLVFGVLT
jgi:hypothetical protein